MPKDDVRNDTDASASSQTFRPIETGKKCLGLVYDVMLSPQILGKFLESSPLTDPARPLKHSLFEEQLVLFKCAATVRTWKYMKNTNRYMEQ